MKLELRYPIEKSHKRISQYFGENLNPSYKQYGLKGHNGLDIPCDDGAPVYAAHEGVVTFTGEDGSGGLGVVIRSQNQYDHAEGTSFIKSIYWHLKPSTFKVKPGDIVQEGQHIADADNTGNSTGTHLHFGIKPTIQGENDWEWENPLQNNGFKGAIDPYPYLKKDFNYTFENTLRLGDRGPEVAFLQRALRDMGFFTYPQITGYYGSITASAVLDFQIRFKVAMLAELFLPFLRGKSVGPKTREKLNEYFGVK